MPATSEVVSTNLVDSAVGAINVTISTVTGFDIDDYVSTTVQSLAISIKLFNLAQSVNAQAAAERRKVSIAGATVGGY